MVAQSLDLFVIAFKNKPSALCKKDKLQKCRNH